MGTARASDFGNGYGRSGHRAWGVVLLLALEASAAGTSAGNCLGTSPISIGQDRCVEPLAEFQDCPQCPLMIALPAGSFRMGSQGNEPGQSSTEAPQHCVRLGYNLALAKFETTFADWDLCVAEGGCTHRPRDSGWGRGRQPVINVSWDDVVQQYLPWLGAKTGYVYRLPTEAEWEYAARAGTETAFSSGTTISSDQANYDGTAAYAGSEKGTYRKKPSLVGSFPPNAFGLHDMHGNVWEWVQDCYTGDYSNAPTDGSAAAERPGCQRVMRGGSWIDGPRALRSVARGHVPPNTRFIYRGFRVARDLGGRGSADTGTAKDCP